MFDLHKHKKLLDDENCLFMWYEPPQMEHLVCARFPTEEVQQSNAELHKRQKKQQTNKQTNKQLKKIKEQLKINTIKKIQ